eukprot:Sspe_Gene.108199::Locus_87360_Transcript_1_1_Confidence_1.000_Length_717::g.108199::m.108199
MATESPLAIAVRKWINELPSSDPWFTTRSNYTPLSARIRDTPPEKILKPALNRCLEKSWVRDITLKGVHFFNTIADECNSLEELQRVITRSWSIPNSPALDREARKRQVLEANNKWKRLDAPCCKKSAVVCFGRAPEPGELVEAHDNKVAPALNGLQGRVRGIAGNGRVLVVFDAPYGVVSLRLRNIRLVSEVSEA